MKMTRNLLPWIIWLVAALFYGYEFFLRISPEVMVQDLERTFAVSAAALGSLSAFYYYAYAVMQIPVGVLLDRFGTRKLLSLSALIVAFGCWLFATTTSLHIAEFGRLLMGVGSAFAFVGCLKLASAWFPRSQFALVVGLTNMLGVIGAINGEAPLAAFVDHVGWRSSMLYAAVVGFAIAILIMLVVRNQPKQAINKPSEPQLDLWGGIRYIWCCKQTWLVAIFGSLMVAPIAGFGELWAVPFLQKLNHLSHVETAGIASLVFVGIAVGGPVNGWISGKLGKRSLIMLVGALFALASLCLIIYVPLKHAWLVGLLLFVFGFFTSSMLLCFALNTEYNPVNVSGVVIGFTNMIVMLGGVIFQPLIGVLLDDRWSGAMHQGARVYSIQDYQHALSILPISIIAALVLLLFIKDSYCKQCK